MSSIVEESNSSYLKPLIRKIVENVGKKFEDVRYEVSTPGESFYISDTLFVTIITDLDNEISDKNTLSVVIKKPPFLESVREMMRVREQFHNEILFYQKYGKEHPEIPRCICAEESPPTDSVIVLENVVAHKGYKLCEWKYDVPFKYTIAAFREIARFHAKAYAMKESRRQEFFNIVEDIWEARYFPGSNLKYVINDTATRPIEYLRNRGYDLEFCEKLERKLKNTYENVMLKIIEPEEPFATLCHGDFTVNNTLFKEEDEELKVMFIDFALTRYGSPILDLSTFLCLHCAKDLNGRMLDHLLKVYHDSLKESLAEIGVNGEIYSYESLKEDFRRRALFGFFIANFFLSTAMGKGEKNPQDFADVEPELLGGILRQLGGDEISEILANMLLKLRDYGCLNHLLI